MAGSSPSFRPHSGWTCAVAGKLLSTLLLVSGLAGIAVWKLGPTFAEHDGLHHVASSQVNLRHRRLRQCENSWERQLAHILRVNPNEDCSDDDCELTPFCYDPLLNVGPQLACCDGNVRVFSNEILVEDEDSSLFEELEAQGLGLAVDSTGKYQVRLIIAERPSCNSVNLLTDTHEGATYYEYIEHLKQRLQHHQLSCNLNHWELIQVSENNTVCRSQANDFLHSPLNERYNDVELTTIAFDESTGGWTSGWAQGWCPPFAAVEGKCDVNLPFASRLQGNSGNGSNTGFKPDGGLAIDFDSGLNGEFGARQVHSEPNYDDHIAFFRKGGLKDEWLNDLAIVEDGEHPEEGHVARLAAFIRNNGTQEEPEWVPAHHGGLTTTRLFGSGRYEVRAKVPLAEGFAWGMWTEYSSGPIYADRPKPSSCSSFEGLQAGDMESCASCAEYLPESGSPFWLKKEKGSVNAQEIDNMCPPAAADVRKSSPHPDGLIDTLEGVPFYGGIQVSLTTEGDTSPDSALALDRFPVANDDGTLWYHRSIQVSENVADHIDMLHYVIHGIDLDGSNGYNGVTGPLGAPLEATVPAGCGGTSEGIPVHVLRADLDAVPHNEEADGGSDVTGHARIIVHGTTVRVYVEASGLSPDLPHAMHIHGAVSDDGDGEESDNDGSMCPPATADVRGLNGTDSPPDGFIDVLEGVPFYGGILASLTTEGDTSPDSALALDRFPVADGDGHLTYYRVFEVSEDVSAGLAQLHIVIHGLDLDDDGEYDGEAGSLGAPLEATLPVTCGELEVVSMDGTMYELMVGAVPHAEDADGGSNVEGHGYVVVADAVLYVDMYVEGVAAGVPHAQHFHGSMMAGARNMCPPAAADVRGLNCGSDLTDGLIDTLEGVPFYGGIQVSLTTEGDTSPDSALALDRFPVANDDGTLWYHRSIQVSENVADHIDMLHYVIHGIDLDGSNGYNGVTGPLGAPLEATVPAGCGGTSEGIPVHVLRADLDAVPHNEEADGGSDVTGHARIIVHGTTVRVYVEASGLSPDLPHAMHIHGAVSDGGDGEESDNDGSMCPPATADVRGLNGTDSPPDGFIDVLEGVPFYGGILASLTTEGDTSPDSALALDRFPVADRDGHLTYYRVFEVSEDVSANLAQLHIVIHGLDLDDDGEYDGEAGSLGAPLEATLPVTCGELEVVSMDGTMYELMVGAVPHAEDADGGSNVEGHGYVVVADAVLYVDMYVEGVTAGVPHAQHFHGKLPEQADSFIPAGFYTPTAGTEYLQSEVNFLFPGHMGTLDNSNIASIINRRWSSPDHDGTQSHFLIVGNESFIGDGAYHDYAFEWHTGGHTSNGYQEPRVDYYIDGVYTGSNTIAVPSVVGRFNLMLFPADWNGDLAPEQAEGDAQSSLHTYLLYATAYVSKVSITPFYESNDAVLPAAYDQPDLNRRAVCGEDVFIPCGTNPIVPFTTPNHYISPEDGGPVTPCCGAVCMSTEEEECPTGVNSVYVVGNRPAQDCRCTHSGPDEFGDPTFSGEEFDATCLWHPTKPRDFEPSECTRRDYPMQLDYYRGRGPWDINLGCRYDINRVCVDANLNEEEMVQSCYDWLDENCGQLFNRTYWEAWVERPSLRCRLYIRPPYHENNIDYTVYPGVTPSNIGEVLLPEADYFQGCRFNFLKNPPIYIPSNTSEEASSEGEGNPQTSGDQESANDPSRRQLDHLDRPQFDPTGCSWALDYCPGATIEMFNVAVSRRTDINGNRVCEIQRKDEFTPSRPRDLEYPGTRGTCDVDYEEFMPWCESDDDCEDWTGDHCDVPAALSVKCSEAHFCHISFNNSVAPEMPPVPLCYPMDEEKGSEPYRGCSRNYNARPPCGDTVSDCKEFVESHCDDPSVYVITLAEELDRNGNARCIIQREHDLAVGSPDQACEASECFSCQRDGCNSSEPAFPSPSPIAVTSSPLPSPSPAPMEAESSVFRVAAEGFGSLSSTEFEDHIVDWIDVYSDDNDLNVVVAAIATRVNLAGDLLVFDANVTVIGASLDLEQLAQNLDALAENLLQYLNNEVFVLEFICSIRVSPRRIAEGA